MESKQARQSLHDSWERRIGAKSGRLQKLSPRSIGFWRLLYPLPEAAVHTLLSGISVKLYPQAREGRPVSALCRGVALVPPALCAALCVVRRTSAVASGVLTLVCSVSGAFLGRWLERSSSRNTAAAPGIEVDSDALERSLDLWERGMNDLFGRLAEEERDMSLGHDVTDDPAFGEWVQKFVHHARRHPEDLALGSLKEELVSKLSAMGITVYDELRMDGEGAPVLPEQDCFTGAREGEHYSEVTRAAVYSRRRPLAQGEIR